MFLFLEVKEFCSVADLHILDHLTTEQHFKNPWFVERNEKHTHRQHTGEMCSCHFHQLTLWNPSTQEHVAGFHYSQLLHTELDGPAGQSTELWDPWFWIDVIIFGNVFPSFSAFPQRWEQRLQEQKQRTARSKNQNAGRSGRSGASKPSNKNTNTLVSGPKKATKTRNGQKETNAKKVWVWHFWQERKDFSYTMRVAVWLEWHVLLIQNSLT